MGWINKQQMNEEKIVCETETLTELPIKTDLGPIPRLFWPSSCTPWVALSFRFAAQLYLLLTLHPIPVMLSHVWLFLTPWTVAHQAPLSMEFSRQEYWSGLLSPSPGDLPYQGSNLAVLHSRLILYCLSHQRSPLSILVTLNYEKRLEALKLNKWS